ncbi:MAG: hypothetical protein SWH54_09745 [Thermodesulfobacteriota bacterium]|nr:hypothetical protein [Thermodesulfobacteriota bacterium]
MWRQELARELKEAKNGDKDKVIENYRKMTGRSTQSLYRIAAQNGFNSGRKKRKDNGSCRLNDEQLHFISGLVHTSSRELKGTIMDVETALSIAEDNGIIDPGTCSVAWLTRLLRDRQMNAAALNTPEPHIQMRSLHPNHVHIFDASVCIQYYLKGRKGLHMMREDKFYKNKWQNFATVKKKLIRYILTDHFSHIICVKYYYTGGETQANLYDFLLAAWSGGKREKFPFRGVPFFMLMDAGAANISKAILAFLERLEIEIPKSLPHNPGRQGSAEVAQNIVESKFESRLRFQPAQTVQELNDWALDWCVHFNGTKKHTRHGMTRSECWLKIKKEELRELPDKDILHDLFAEPETDRTVTGRYSISFRSEEYNLKHIEGLLPNRSKVKVVLRPFLWPEIGVIFKDQEYLVKPIGRVDGGFREDAAVIGREYKRMPDTLTQKAKKRGENLAFGEDRPKDAVPFGGITVFGNQADKVNRTYMPRLGTPLNTAKTAENVGQKQIPIMTVLKKLSTALGLITPELNTAIRQAYGTSMSLAESDRLYHMAMDHGSLTPADLGGDNASLKTAAV